MPTTIPIEKFHEEILVTLIEDFKDVDMKPALDNVGDAMASFTSDNFLSQSDPNGNPWAALSPVTVARKGHDTILVDSTAMRKSVVLREHPNHVEKISDDEIMYGTNIAYAVVHQEGTGNIPQREFLGMDNNDADVVADIVADHFVEALKE